MDFEKAKGRGKIQDYLELVDLIISVSYRQYLQQDQDELRQFEIGLWVGHLQCPSSQGKRSKALSIGKRRIAMVVSFMSFLLAKVYREFSLIRKETH